MRREIRPEAFLARLPLFNGLGRDELARLAAATTRHELRRGDVLFRQGEPATGFHAVVHGRMALTSHSAGGRERVNAIVEAGRSFGEAIMFLEKPYVVSARALGDALVLHIAKEAVFAELERSPGFARRVIAALAAKLHASVQELDLYALGTGDRRVAAWLLRSLPAGAGGPEDLTLPAAKRAIASQLNLSAEHFSRVLRELSGRGLIEVDGRRVRVPDVQRLKQVLSSGA